MAPARRSTKTKSKAQKVKARAKKPATPPLRNDLNAKFPAGVRALRRRPLSFDNVQNVTMLFDDIESHLCHLIRNPRVHYVMVAAPWCSSKALFAALASKQGVGLLTQPDKHVRSAVRRQAYGALKPIEPGMDRVRGLVMGRGRQKSILHQKMLVFLDQDRTAIGAATGSFNLSGANGSSSNIENFLVMNDARVADECAQEWRRVYAISKRLFA